MMGSQGLSGHELDQALHDYRKQQVIQANNTLNRSKAAGQSRPAVGRSQQKNLSSLSTRHRSMDSLTTRSPPGKMIHPQDHDLRDKYGHRQEHPLPPRERYHHSESPNGLGSQVSPRYQDQQQQQQRKRHARRSPIGPSDSQLRRSVSHNSLARSNRQKVMQHDDHPYPAFHMPVSPPRHHPMLATSPPRHPQLSPPVGPLSLFDPFSGIPHPPHGYMYPSNMMSVQGEEEFCIQSHPSRIGHC